MGSLSSETVLCPRDRPTSHSDPLTDTSTTPDDIQTTPAAAKQLIGQEGQRTLLRPLGGFPPGAARFPPNNLFSSIQTTKDFNFRSFSNSNKKLPPQKKKKKKKKKS